MARKRSCSTGNCESLWVWLCCPPPWFVTYFNLVLCNQTILVQMVVIDLILECRIIPAVYQLTLILPPPPPDLLQRGKNLSSLDCRRFASNSALLVVSRCIGGFLYCVHSAVCFLRCGQTRGSIVGGLSSLEKIICFQ